MPIPSLDIDAPCRGCGYNLRGLSGDVVVCPECGQHHDFESLVNPPKSEPWEDLAEFEVLHAPVLWAVMSLGVLVAGVVFLELAENRIDAQFAENYKLVVILGAMTGWIWLLQRVQVQWRSWMGVACCGLLHVCGLIAFVAIAAVFIGGCMLLWGTFALLRDEPGAVRHVLVGGSLVAGFAVLCTVHERLMNWIGRQTMLHVTRRALRRES